MLSNERIFFFPGSHGRNLLGFLHMPKRNPRRTGIVFGHPFAEEKNCSHAVTVKAARAFAELGYPVLRFDFSGCGDSEGNFEEIIIDDWIRDLDSAVRHIKSETRVNQVALWGLRFGGGLALIYSMKYRTIDFLILWQPVVDFAEHIRQFLRQKLGASLTQGQTDKITLKAAVAQLESSKNVEIIGYTLTPSLYRSFLAIGRISPNNCPQHPIYLLSVSLTDTVPFTLRQFSESLGEFVTEFKSDHITAEPFWDRYWCWDAPMLISRTGQWLQYLNR